MLRELLNEYVYPKNEFVFPSEIVEENLKCTVYPMLFQNYNFKISQYNKIISWWHWWASKTQIVMDIFLLHDIFIE